MGEIVLGKLNLIFPSKFYRRMKNFKYAITCTSGLSCYFSVIPSADLSTVKGYFKPNYLVLVFLDQSF